MTWQHKNWGPAGRTEENSDNPIERRWTGAVNQKCTWDGTQWLPYLWKVAENKLQYAQNEEVGFASDKQILRHAGSVICSSMKLFVQAYRGNQWVDQPHGVPTRNITHDYPKEGACTGYLDFPDAHLSFGAQLPYDLQAGLEISYFSAADLGLRLRSPVSGQVRFQIVLDGLEKLFSGWEWIDRGGPPKGQGEVRHVGIKTNKMSWRWSYEEAPFRSIGVETNPDDSLKITVTFGPYTVAANTWLTVYPDTWGPTEVTTDANDGSEYSPGNSGSYAGTWDVNGVYDTGNLYLERLTTVSDGYEKISAWRWLPDLNTAAPGVASINAGTQIVFTNGGDNNTPTGVTATLGADNAADAPVWGSGTARPSQRTMTAATVALTGSTGNQKIGRAHV